MLVDRGSSAEVLFWDAFQKMSLDEKMLVPIESPMVAFDGTRVFPRGIMRLMVHVVERTLPVNFFGDGEHISVYAIMGQGWIHAMHVVVSTLH